MVLIDDILHDVESDASAWLVALSLEERIEDTALVFLPDADAIIADLDTEVLAVGLHHTSQPHVVLRIFVGVGQQIADHLRDGLLVNHGREPLIRIVNDKPLTALLKRRGETLTDGPYQLMDILWGEMHHQHQFLHLAEVEQLVNQF